MGTYELQDPTGKTYDVEAPSLKEAVDGFKKWRQDQVNAKHIQEAETAPEWKKPIMAADDVVRSGADLLTFGGADKALDYFGGSDENQMRTAAAKNRMGWAGTALDVGLLSRFLPTAVPKVVKAMGGGPAAKTIVGTATAAGEGATYGGVTAATHDQDVPAGVLGGGVGGAAGYQIGSLINKGYKRLKGIDDIPPNAGIKVMPKAPTKEQLAEISFNQARAKAARSDNPLAEQAALRKTAAELAETPRGTGTTPLYSPGQVAQLNKIAAGDPATNAARKFGSFLDNKMIGASGIGGGLAAGFGTGNPGFGMLAGAAVAGGVAGGANLLKKASAAGTEEQVQNFRRIMTRTPKYMGPISVAERNRIAKMAREGVLNYYGED